MKVWNRGWTIESEGGEKRERRSVDDEGGSRSFLFLDVVIFLFDLREGSVLKSEGTS